MYGQRLEITVPPGKKRERLDLFLAHQVENVSRNKVQQAIKQGFVTVDGYTVKSNHIVSPGEVISITFPKPPPQKAIPEKIPLDIIHEDDVIIVVNKPAGMVTHPAYGNYSGTLVNALLYHIKQKSDRESGQLAELAETGDPMRPGLIHRLDKDTSGLLVVAKTEEAHRFLAEQFSKRSIKREYRAIVWGNFKNKGGRIDAKLGRSKSDRKKIAVREEGKPATTTYEVVEEYEQMSLISLHLLTGRTHQIRVHLSSIGHPVFGDPTYGGRRISHGKIDPERKRFIDNLLTIMKRQALHAKLLGFIHPLSRENVQFNSDLPFDMETAISTLKKSSYRYLL